MGLIVRDSGLLIWMCYNNTLQFVEYKLMERMELQINTNSKYADKATCGVVSSSATSNLSATPVTVR